MVEAPVTEGRGTGVPGRWFHRPGRQGGVRHPARTRGRRVGLLVGRVVGRGSGQDALGRPGQLAGRRSVVDGVGRPAVPALMTARGTAGGGQVDAGVERILEIAHEVAARVVAVLRRLGHGPEHHVVDRSRQLGTDGGDRGRKLDQVGPQHRSVIVAAERQPPGEALVQHAPQRIDVGARAHRGALDLLGRDVVDRAEEVPGAGQGSRQRGGPLREPEVGEVDVVGVGVAGVLGDRGDQDVAGLDVTVDETEHVRRVERIADLHEEAQDARGRQRALLGEELLQVAAGDVAHGDEQVPIRLAGLVDGHDVGVVQGRREPGLADEPLLELLVLRERGGQQLQGNLAAEARVLGAVDHGHAATADHRLDAVARDLSPCVEFRHHAPSCGQLTGSPHHPQYWCWADRRPPHDVQNRKPAVETGAAEACWTEEAWALATGRLGCAGAPGRAPAAGAC